MDVRVPLLSMARRIAALLGAAALMALTAGGYARARDAVSAVRVDWRVLHCATTVRRPLSAALQKLCSHAQSKYSYYHAILAP